MSSAVSDIAPASARRSPPLPFRTVVDAAVTAEQNATATRPQRKGIELLIGTSHVSYERLPMLEIVCDRMMRLMTTTLRNMMNDNVDVSLESLSSERFGDILRGEPGHAIFAVFKAEEWENYGVVILSSSLVYMFVDALLGGGCRDTDSGGAPPVWPDRPHTTIERNLMEPLVRAVLADLSHAFGPLCAVTFRFDRLELNSRFVAISRETNGAVAARFLVSIGNGRGEMTVVLPHATLEPVRDVLLQQFMGEKFGHDQTWEQHLAQELWQTELELDCVIDEQMMSLSDILKLKPGQKLVLQHREGAFAQLRCGGTTMFSGRIGQYKGRVAFKIEGPPVTSAPSGDLDAEIEQMGEENG